MKSVVKTMLTTILIFTLICQSSDHSNAQADKFNMTYIYFGSPNSYVKQVDVAKNSFSVVTPNYFDIRPDGSLEITWRLQSSFINEMHQRGIRVVPFISNHWNEEAGRNGLLHRDQLAKDIAAAIEKYQLDGVNVDIEGVNRSGEHSGYFRSYRDEYTDFIKLLRQYIPKNKEVSVAVAGNPNGWQTGWHGFYDYKALSEHVNYLMLMSYDESWGSPQSPIGPVASLSFQERSIQYAINAGVPKEKIVNGLPFYARMWKLDGPTLEGRNITGMGLSWNRVPTLIEKFNGSTHFDEKAQSPYATFTVPKGEYAIIGTTKLTEGNYVVWYENEKSIKSKLKLITEYGIRGTGSWALSMEPQDMWEYYSLWLNGKFFADVESGHWAEGRIISVYNRQWMNGTTSTTFSPNDTLTRAQGAVILVRALGYSTSMPREYMFTDTTGHWARNEIEVARELGIINGFGDNRFVPNATLTREQLATIFNNIFNYSVTEVEESPFSDVKGDRWSYPSILAIQQKGHITGFEDGTFRPGANTTRVQMAALMDRMATEFEAYRK
jgi:spore germination protein YaaH